LVLTREDQGSALFRRSAWERSSLVVAPLHVLQEYIQSIQGVGIYRANAGPFDAPRWEHYKAAEGQKRV
jgi:hypothetical protein